MLRFWWAVAAGAMLVAGVGPRPVGAQQWNDSTTRALVQRAVERRAQQLADTGLVDYRAEAKGYVTFLAQVGEGFTELPRILKADQLALEVYWKAPNLSKQRILGRRDTLLLPTDIQYHRDHLGIIQNNFPDIIRLGEGDEVRDVPHPLSPVGLAEYDFAVADSLRISIPGKTIDVYEVRVRPRNDRTARVLGAVYLDRATAQVVRMAFSFTRAAFLDRNLEDLFVVLENRLVGTRFWLPSRQEIEIRRKGTWLDYPVRGIIRGRWEIANYQFNVGLRETQFAGAEIVTAPAVELRSYRWEGKILDSLPPDVRAVTAEEVKRVQAEARTLVRAQALQRAKTTSLAIPSISEFVRVNRAEGLAAGAGLSQRFGAGFAGDVRGRWGFSDHELKGEVGLGWQRADGVRIRAFARRDFREAGDVAEVSALRNTLASQEFGSDYTDPYWARGGGVRLDFGRHFGGAWSLEGAREKHSAAELHATPASGSYEGTLGIPTSWVTRAALSFDRPTALAPLGFEAALGAELRATTGRRVDVGERVTAVRFTGALRMERPVGANRVASATTFTAAGPDAAWLPQELSYVGGPVSAPGYDYHSLAGRVTATQRLEWRMPTPFPRIPLGRFGAAPGSATLAPYVHLAAVGQRTVPRRLGMEGVLLPSPAVNAAGVYPSVGVGLLTIFDLFRIDLARGLRGGRWMLSVDVAPEFWRIL